MIVIDVLLWALAVTVGIPVSVFTIEAVIGVVAGQPKGQPSGSSGQEATFAIIVPAHNEEQTIDRTLDSVTEGLPNKQDVVVVADNCEDSTAELARSHGVTVLERFDDDLRGKGYALDAGLETLRDTSPDVVVFIDADCLVEVGAIQTLVNETVRWQRPVQLTYLLSDPPADDHRAAVSWFAMLFKNLIRPRGLKRLGGPCQIMGTGFAIPWSLFDRVELASGNIVEDMQLGIDLALSGFAPKFCEAGRVLSDMAPTSSAAETQRTRWEHGHLQTLVTQVPRLLGGFVKRFDLRLLLMALDLAVPPLSLLVMGWLAMMVLAVVVIPFGVSAGPSLLLGSVGFAMVLVVAAGWFRFARRTIPPAQLLSIPGYLLWKIPIYLRFVIGRQTNWVRTDRQ